jgi:hypothetical protein
LLTISYRWKIIGRVALATRPQENQALAMLRP